MKATDQLKAEHEGIKRMLKILAKVCEKLETKREMKQEHLERILEFLKIFTDKCHHGKEEDLLFPAMEKTGVIKDSRLISVIRMEHNQGRSFINGMSEAFDKHRTGDPAASLKIAENGRKYIALLTQHIEKENKVLFHMADKCLPKERQEELAEGFEKLEVERIGIGKHEEFHELLGHLTDVYLK